MKKIILLIFIFNGLIIPLKINAQVEPMNIEKGSGERRGAFNHRAVQVSKFTSKWGQRAYEVYNPNGELIYTCEPFHQPKTISNLGKYFISGRNSDEKLIEITTKKEIVLINPGGEIVKKMQYTAFSQTDKFIILDHYNRYRKVYDLKTGSLKQNITLAQQIEYPFFFNDKFALCESSESTNNYYNRSYSYDVFDTDKETVSFKIEGEFSFFSKDEKLIITNKKVYNALSGTAILNTTISDLSDDLRFGFIGSKIYDLSTGTLFYDFGKFYIIQSISNTKVVATYQGLEKHTFDLDRIKVYGTYKPKIDAEFAKINTKDEFETQEEFNNRYAKEKNSIFSKYENINAEKSKVLIKTIKESYSQVQFNIEILGQYIPEREEFPVTINGVTMLVKIPKSEARSFKENYTSAKATASKQLNVTGTELTVYNIKIAHPLTGSIYAFGEQRKALYIDEETANSAESGVPKLTIKAKLVEPSGNNLIDGNENSFIEVVIENSGNGSAKDVRINMTGSTEAGVKYDKAQKITGVASGQSQTVKMNIESDRNIKNGSIEFNINVTEWKGFNPTPIKLTVNTQEFKKPNLVYIESGIKELMGNSNNIIENNEIIEVSALIQNKGQGVSEVTQVLFAINDANIITTTPKKLNQKIGVINPGESKTITFAFTVNNEYNGSNSLPIDVVLSEKFNSYGGKFPIGLDLKKVSLAAQNIKVEGEYSKDKLISEVSLTSEIDKNIPEDILKKPKRYALIIGNENYSKYQTGLNSESNVDYAGNDATTFAKYAEKTLGVPKENISLHVDAIGSKMKSEIKKMCKIAEYSNGEAEIIFFYAGHGFPDEETKEGFIIPVDITGANVKEGIMLTKLYQQLTKNPVKRVTVFLDACFSGGGRNAGLLAARGVKIKPKEGLIEGNLVVFSASSGDQTSLPYKDKAHGMFTYFLLKKIQETKGNINYKDLADFIKKEVQLNSVIINSKDQNPDVLYNPQIEGQWENWNFK